MAGFGIAQYFEGVSKALDTIEIIRVHELADEILSIWQNEKKVFVFGNGGSAATASHFVCDLSKLTVKEDLPRLRVMALTDNVPLMTAWGNDSSYSDIFVEQLRPWLEQGDLVIGISASGNSPNVVKALTLAKQAGCKTAALIGFSGGAVKSIVDLPIIVYNDNMQIIEDGHSILCHALSVFVSERLGVFEKMDLLQGNSRGALTVRNRAII